MTPNQNEIPPSHSYYAPMIWKRNYNINVKMKYILTIIHKPMAAQTGKNTQPVMKE